MVELLTLNRFLLGNLIVKTVCEVFRMIFKITTFSYIYIALKAALSEKEEVSPTWVPSWVEVVEAH